jgi:hypothetical protein
VGRRYNGKIFLVKRAVLGVSVGGSLTTFLGVIGVSVYGSLRGLKYHEYICQSF